MTLGEVYTTLWQRRKACLGSGFVHKSPIMRLSWAKGQTIAADDEFSVTAAVHYRFWQKISSLSGKAPECVEIASAHPKGEPSWLTGACRSFMP